MTDVAKQTPAARAAASAPVPAFPAARCWPLHALADGRKPVITSGFWTRNASRADLSHRHYGVDLLYRWQPSDGPVRTGDGGAARDPATHKPRWFVPSGAVALASAAGVVAQAKPWKTGFLVWLDHHCGWWTGYMHLRRLLVKAGDAVEMGQPVGEVGDNPMAYDPTHLHFETLTTLHAYPAGCHDPELWLRSAQLSSRA